VTAIIAGTVAATLGYRADGCGIRTAEPSGYNHAGSPTAVAGYSTGDIGDDEVSVLGEAGAPTLKISRGLEQHSIKFARRQNVPLHES